ncbi:phage tail tube protein [Streptosporangium sp. NBC_01810]|uniref:phage tail tube protein n=1 Tax=Streptosporangium sp. NBC_01810 TaxID=2975951 RepID=UPI002DDC4EE8|nr:phage tail tube protein [Streptosporangium sp. NBC_01810]WSA27419.1 phage tail tube protein [Streptosporangium sp. NBC_01810]
MGVFAGSKRWVGIAKEVTPGTAVAPALTIPVDKFDPSDDVTQLDDQALRGSMAKQYGQYSGPIMSSWDLGGPMFGDGLGYLLHNILGGYAVSGVAAPYSHTFSLLNSGDGQPVTHTLTDVTGVPAVSGARQYPYSCLSELTLTWNAEQLCSWEAKAQAWPSVVPGVAPTNTLSSVPPVASWRGAVGIGGPASAGTLVTDVTEMSITISREVTPYHTADGSQSPFVIARGPVDVTGKFTQIAQSEQRMLDLLANTQPQLQFVLSNGLTLGALISVQFDLQKVGYRSTKINTGTVFQYDVEFTAIANSTNVGASGGFAPAKVTLQNAVVTY